MQRHLHKAQFPARRSCKKLSITSGRTTYPVKNSVQCQLFKFKSTAASLTLEVSYTHIDSQKADCFSSCSPRITPCNKNSRAKSRKCFRNSGKGMENFNRNRKGANKRCITKDSGSCILRRTLEAMQSYWGYPFEGEELGYLYSNSHQS